MKNGPGKKLRTNNTQVSTGKNMWRYKKKKTHDIQMTNIINTIQVSRHLIKENKIPVKQTTYQPKFNSRKCTHARQPEFSQRSVIN